MCSFLYNNIQAIVNSIGLLLDIAGAWFVAWEVIQKYEGKKIQVTGGVLRTDYIGSNGTPVVAGQITQETNEYKNWELKKYTRMKLGLIFLTMGFIFQLISNWIPKLI